MHMEAFVRFRAMPGSDRHLLSRSVARLGRLVSLLLESAEQGGSDWQDDAMDALAEARALCSLSTMLADGDPMAADVWAATVMVAATVETLATGTADVEEGPFGESRTAA
jgi:hypothetical protein